MKRQKKIRGQECAISYYFRNKFSFFSSLQVSVSVSAETGTRAEGSVTVSVSAENRVSVNLPLGEKQIVKKKLIGNRFPRYRLA